MIIHDFKDEDFVNYKRPCMFIAMPTCTFKCEKDAGRRCCQNADISLSRQQPKYVPAKDLVRRYLGNNITSAVVFGGLEPLDSLGGVITFIKELREAHCDDYVVIYTGYKKEEIADIIEALAEFKNVIVKFGRYVPDQKPHKDPVLGVELASDNQYAEIIS